MKEFVWEYGPIVVKGGSEDYVHRHQEVLDVRGWVRGIWVFHGLDRGNIVEMDTEIHEVAQNITLVARSEHKETLDNFDAWKYYPVNDDAMGLRVTVVCRVNGQTGFIKPMSANVFRTEEMIWLGLQARPHWGVRVVYDPNEVSFPPPTGDPDEDEPQLIEYVPKSKIDEWSKKARDAWDPWDQWRDLEYLLVYGKQYWNEPFGITEVALEDLVEEGSRLNYEFMRLEGDLEKGVANRRCSVENPAWCDRTNIRKDRVLAFIEECNVQQEQHDALRKKIEGQPGEGVNWDSIKGWLTWVQKNGNS